MAMTGATTKVLTQEDVALLVRVEKFALTIDEVLFCSADRSAGEKVIFLSVGVARDVGPARRTWIHGLLSSRAQQQGWTPNIRILRGSGRGPNAESDH